MSDFAGIDELVSNGKEGFVISKDDAETMAKKACFLIRNATLREKMGEGGKKKVTTQFSIEKMATNLFNIYMNCFIKKSQYR